MDQSEAAADLLADKLFFIRKRAGLRCMLLVGPGPQAHPEPKTQNQKLDTLTPKPETGNQNPETR